MNHTVRLPYLILVAVLFSSSVLAQTAVLRGQVADESGAVIPGAKVTLTGSGVAARTVDADGTGSYSFAGLPPGTYSVQASAPQLKQDQPVRITLKPGTQSLNLVLHVASRAEKLTVQDTSAPSLSTDSSSNASAVVLRGTDLDALSDDPDDLAADLQALAGPSAGPNGGSIFVDGFSGGQLPPKESIREIRINQNPFSPEYDKLGYGKIEIFTKPGSDKYHGTAQWNFANDFWNTRNPYAPDKAYFLLNEFEGNAGGPVTKKSSFTVDAQRNMVDNGSITNVVTVNPQTFALEPFAGVLVTPGRYTNVSPRIDYQLSENNTVMFRYGITHSDVRDNGIGAFDLTSRGYHSQFTNQTVQAADTVLIGKAVNETRFQFYRSASQSIANATGPTTQVLQSFNGGGSTLGQTYDTQNSYELQNYTSLIHGTHSWRFGVRLRGQTDDNVSPQNFNGTFTFSGGALEPVLNAQNQAELDGQGNMVLAPITSIERYRRTLLFQQLGFTAAQIRNLGGGATQFSISSGTAGLAVHQVDAGLFAGDEWRVRPNFTLNLGLRYETQTNIHDYRDIAPRIAFAWAPGGGGNKRSKTVVRAGFGTFYDRFPLSATLAAQRYNGLVQQQYVVTNPDFFPNVPVPASLAGFQSTQVIQEISSRLRAPYILQSAVTVERQLPRNTTLAVTYTNSHGLHVLRSEDINAPLPGTYNPAGANSGIYPLGHPGAVNLAESSGLYNQNQLISNVNARLNSGVSLFGFYVYNRARSNTDGLSTFPANPYNFNGEYGPAATDVHHRVTIGGSINLRWAVRISPFVVMQSGAPFDITAGNDLYGTTLFNARPAIATDPAKPGLIETAYGLLDPNPTPGERLVSRNFGRGPGQYNVNLRIAKTIGFGRERGGSGDARPSGGPANPIQAVTGRGLAGLIGSPTTTHRFNLSIGLSIRNLLNHTNPGPIVGNITSPYFGFANQIAGSQNGEGFYETANNRRLESQIKFTF
ncbi:MAG TPA: carboxypeptidase regulatory-like domain-containing protein [Bryobacteraceae bacterium]|nr:carboxypeptidase regulatory-like domain-containing protein [Bryobacteraceae bacterium]